MSHPPQPGQQPNPQWQQQPGQYPPQPGPGWGGPVPPPKKSRTGLIVALSVIGGLVVLGGCGALVAGLASVGTTTEDSATGHSPASTAPEKSAPAEKAEKPAEEKKPVEQAEDKGPEADVEITKCEVNSSTTWPAAEVEIVNHGKEKFNYIVSVEFVNSSGDRLGEGMAATNNLAPGQKSTQTAQGLDKTSGKVTCKITDVSRYSLP